jgi:NAD(P)-dependent dehydrogenase (short-subunit alcohol dehydrogenase family)
MSKLSRKIGLITGGNSGIGLAAARRFVQEGAGEETVSDHEIWSAIRYLDPETKETGHNIAVTITLIAIFSVCLACIVFYLRGL